MVSITSEDDRKVSLSGRTEGELVAESGGEEGETTRVEDKDR